MRNLAWQNFIILCRPKFDQESQSWPKSQWLTKNGQRHDCTIIGLAVWEKILRKPFFMVEIARISYKTTLENQAHPVGIKDEKGSEK